MQKINRLLTILLTLVIFVFSASEIFAQEVTAEASATYSRDPNLFPILIVMSILTIFTNVARFIKGFGKQK